MCKDTGRLYEMQEENGRSYSIMRPCVCKLEKIRRQKLQIIPPKYQNAVLADLIPDTERSERQAEIFQQMKNAPDESFFFGGKFGTGKTMCLWTLYREAVMNDRKTVACTLTELLNEYKAFIQASISGQPLVYPRLAAGDLRQTHTRYSIFLDDIDKAKPTEYAAEQLFELANAIHDFNHQIVVTTNLSIERLVQHFDRADDRFGGAIVRRLVEDANIYELFD